MLSDQNIRQLADGTDSNYQFDFSKIQAEFYEPLLRTLQHFAKKKIHSIGFSCDSLAQLERTQLISSTNQNSQNKLPVLVSNSIAKNKSHYISNIVELLYYVFPRSTRIKELTLSNLNIRKDYFVRLINGIAQSKSLERITFNKIPIGDELLRMILTTVDPNKIQSLTFTYCGVTSKSLNDILLFIQKKDPNNKNGISSFQISKAEISEKEQALIQEALQNPSAFNNLSPISNTNKSQKILPNQANSPFSTPLISPIHTKYTQAQIESEMAQIRAYESENAQLRKELMDLRNSLHAVQFNENVFIVGKGAEEFVNYISGIEPRIKELEAQKAQFKGIF